MGFVIGVPSQDDVGAASGLLTVVMQHSEYEADSSEPSSPIQSKQSPAAARSRLAKASRQPAAPAPTSSRRSRTGAGAPAAEQQQKQQQAGVLAAQKKLKVRRTQRKPPMLQNPMSCAVRQLQADARCSSGLIRQPGGGGGAGKHVRIGRRGRSRGRGVRSEAWRAGWMRECRERLPLPDLEHAAVRGHTGMQKDAASVKEARRIAHALQVHAKNACGRGHTTHTR